MGQYSLKKILSKILTYNIMHGEIAIFSGATVPSGWLLCNGAAISRETYSKLFDIIGTTYGAGDGSTTFNLPNLIGKFPIGTHVVSYPVGTNLLSDSTADAGQSHTTYNLYDFPFNTALVSGQTYTIKAKINTSSEKTFIGFYHSGGSYSMGSWLPVNSNGLYKIIFTATDTMAAQTGSTYNYGFCRVYVSNNARGSQDGLAQAGTANVEWISIEAGEQGVALNDQFGYKDAIIPAHIHSISAGAVTIGAMSANASHSHYMRQIASCLNRGSTYERPMGIGSTSYGLGLTASTTYINHTHSVLENTAQSQGVTATNMNLPPYLGLKFIIYAGG